jgi:hypothetical protein
MTLREMLQRETWNDRDGETVLTVDDALAALRQWLADEGLVVVPREPTAKMLDANSQCTSQELWAGIGWAAMLSAAPDPLEPDEP